MILEKHHCFLAALNHQKVSLVLGDGLITKTVIIKLPSSSVLEREKFQGEIRKISVG